MPDTVPNVYFQEKRSFAEVKQELLGRYFETWCSLRLAVRPADSEEPLLFVDLNAAAGQDLHAQDTAAVAVLQHLIRSTGKKPGLNRLVRFYFNDPVKAGTAGLAQKLEQLPACEALTQKPAFLYEPENRTQLEELLDGGSPALLFLDPFSYGYAQEVLQKACSTGQPDLLMLLSPDSIRKALTGRKVSQPLTDVLGERLSRISAFCRKEKDNGRRVTYILQHLQSLLREKGFFTLLFQINLPGTGNVSHYLLFSSPHIKAYNCFKETVLPYSDLQQDGVPLFSCNQGQQHQLSLFEHRPAHTVMHLVDELAASVLQCKFKSVEKVCEMHSPNTPYIPENYLAAFEHLRDQGKVVLLNGKTLQTVRKATLTSVVKYVG